MTLCLLGWINVPDARKTVASIDLKNSRNVEFPISNVRLALIECSNINFNNLNDSSPLTYVKSRAPCVCLRDFVTVSTEFPN